MQHGEGQGGRWKQGAGCQERGQTGVDVALTHRCCAGQTAARRLRTGQILEFQVHRRAVCSFPSQAPQSSTAASPAPPPPRTAATADRGVDICSSPGPSARPAQGHPESLAWAQPGPRPLSTETFCFFLPCIPQKALMRAYFVDNFTTLTISPCNNIFKTAPCL